MRKDKAPGFVFLQGEDRGNEIFQGRVSVNKVIEILSYLFIQVNQGDIIFRNDLIDIAFLCASVSLWLNFVKLNHRDTEAQRKHLFYL